jgi:glycosyltransferase EpsE
MTDVPLVSVVMATYNRGDIISKTIENIFEQDYDSIELIIINDGSIDNTLSVLKDLNKTFNFILINNLQNLGLQKSLNRGLLEAKGKYIARIDDHDLWIDKEKTTKQVAFLESHPRFGLIGSAFKINDTPFINPISNEDIRRQILMRCPFCHQSVLIRNTILKEVGNYDENLTYSEDWDLWLKIATVSKVANLPEITVQVFEPIANDSLSGDFFLKQLPINRQLIKKHVNAFPMAWKAKLYHTFIAMFFSLFKPGSKMHQVMQSIFRIIFLKNDE